MFRRSFRTLLTIATMLALGLTLLPPVAAQSPTDLLPFLDGLESAYARRYVSPAEHAGFGLATPAGFDEEAVPDRVEATVLEFEADTDAKAAFLLLDTDMVIPMLVHEEGITADDFTQVDLGDKAIQYVSEPTDGADGVDGYLFIRDGNLGFIISATGNPAAVVSTLQAFGEFMVNAEQGEGDVVYGDIANSHGGTFDILPAVEDSDILNGLFPMYDYDLLESNSPIEATPAS